MIWQLLSRFRLYFADRLHSSGWSLMLVTLVVLYGAGYLLMQHFGESAIVTSYWWWFVVTVTTVGYGDLFPTTTGGRIVAAVIMVVGIAIIGLAIGKIAEIVLEFANRKARGLGRVKQNGAILMMGYKRGVSGQVLREIKTDEPDRVVVLCDSQLERLPDDMLQATQLIRGELSATDTLTRANLTGASRVVIDGADDNETFFCAYAIRQHNKDVPIVAHLQSQDHADKIRQLPASGTSLNQVVLPVSAHMLAQDLSDAESSEVIHQLVSNMKGANLYRHDLAHYPNIALTFGALRDLLQSQHNATLLAIKHERVQTLPPNDLPLSTAMSVFYVAEQRVESIKLEPHNPKQH